MFYGRDLLGMRKCLKNETTKTFTIKTKKRFETFHNEYISIQNGNYIRNKYI